jgi:DNA invertase Pin-like site-specific DNA recombinase
MAPQKLENKLIKEEKVKKNITIEKKNEIVQKYESGFRVTDLANMYSMSKSTISTILLVLLVNYAHYTTLFIIKRLGKGCFESFGTHYRYFHYFLWEK